MGNLSLSGQIKLVLQTLNLTQTGLATKLGLSQGVISEFTSGSREPSKEFLLGLPKLGISLDWFLTGEGEMLLSPIPAKSEGYKVPLLNQRVSCGDGTSWEDEQNIESYIEVFSMIPQHKLGRLFALSVQGNSMIGAGIKNGDYVLFCTGDDPVLDDDIYVFSLDGEVFCKQLEFDIISKKIKIYSIRVADLEKAELLTTLNVEDTDFADRFHIYGRVFCWLHPNLGDEKK
jgi:SOS-response transcriptional repressor LexA